MLEQERADLRAAADYLEGDGVSLTVAEAQRIAATLRRLADVSDGVSLPDSEVKR